MLDGTAWIELSKNGTVQYSHILREGECFTYEDSGMLHCCVVYRVFTGERRLLTHTPVAEGKWKVVEFSPVKISDIDAVSMPDRSGSIMVGLGVPVELSGGAKLLLKQIDQDGDAVWIEIERNEYEKSGKVINRTHPLAYRVGDTEYVYDLEAVFLGKEKSAIEISFVSSSPVMGGFRCPESYTCSSSSCVHSVRCDCGAGTTGGRAMGAATQLKSENNCESFRSLSKT